MNNYVSIGKPSVITPFSKEEAAMEPNTFGPLEIMIILMLLAFILGLVAGVSLARPNIMR